MIAGTAFLIIRRRSAREVHNKLQCIDRSQHASRANSARGSPIPSPVPPRGPSSPLKVLLTNSPVGSPIPAVHRSATSSPALSAVQSSPPAPTPVGVGSPQLPHRLGLRMPSSPGSASFSRPLSPLSLVGAATTAATESAQLGARTGMRHSSSYGSLYEADNLRPQLSPMSAHSLPGSPHWGQSQLVMARSVSFSEVVAAGQPPPSPPCSQANDEDFTEVQPGCPRTTSFDGLLSPGHISSKPGSPVALKLHVATVLRATAAAVAQPSPGAAAGLPLRPHAGSPQPSEVLPGHSQQAANETPMDSPRGEAMLGLLAAAAAVNQLPDDASFNTADDGN